MRGDLQEDGTKSKPPFLAMGWVLAAAVWTKTAVLCGRQHCCGFLVCRNPRARQELELLCGQPS